MAKRNTTTTKLLKPERDDLAARVAAASLAACRAIGNPDQLQPTLDLIWDLHHEVSQHKQYRRIRPAFTANLLEVLQDAENEVLAKLDW